MSKNVRKTRQTQILNSFITVFLVFFCLFALSFQPLKSANSQIGQEGEIFIKDLTFWMQTALSHAEWQSSKDKEYADLYGQYGPRAPDYPKNSLYLEHSKKWSERYNELNSLNDARKKCQRNRYVIQRIKYGVTQSDEASINYYNHLLQIKKDIETELNIRLCPKVTGKY